MIDREKVLKGLKCCCAMSGHECRQCPYSDECIGIDQPYGMAHLAADALELIQTYQQLLDVNLLMKKLATLDRVAKSDKQKALLGRVFFIIENMIEENRGAINNDGLET